MKIDKAFIYGLNELLAGTPTAARNFYGNLEKLNKHYRIFDSVNIIDTSEIEHVLLATFNNGILQYAVPAIELPKWFVQYMPDMAALIK